MARNARDVSFVLPRSTEKTDILTVFRGGSQNTAPGIENRPLVIAPRIPCVFNGRKTGFFINRQIHGGPQSGAVPEITGTETGAAEFPVSR